MLKFYLMTGYTNCSQSSGSIKLTGSFTYEINFSLYNSPKIDILKKSHKNHHKCSWKIFYLDLHAVYSTTEINWMIYMHLAYMYIVSFANVRLKGNKNNI